MFVVFLALFTGFACTSNYKKEKYELSYTENISVRNSESIVDDKVEVYYAINIISTNRKNYTIKVKYLYNGEEREKEIQGESGGANYYTTFK